jgi:hypothetical protein
MVENIEKTLEGCKKIKDLREKSSCIWQVIEKSQRFVDEARKELPLLNEKEAIASKIIERGADISREIAKALGKEKPIDFSYIEEKKNKLDEDIELLRKRELIFSVL